jgi:hypothetical protein
MRVAHTTANESFFMPSFFAVGVPGREP